MNARHHGVAVIIGAGAGLGRVPAHQRGHSGWQCGQPAVQITGAVTAIRQVLPGMLHRDHGRIVVLTGGSSVVPMDVLGSAGVAMAGLRNYTLALRRGLAGSHVTVTAVTVATTLSRTERTTELDHIADRLLRPGGAEAAEITIGDLDALR